MAKRRAEKELNHDNWNNEDSPDEDVGGPFRRAPPEELAKRKIKTARRRMPEGAKEEAATGVFKSFSGFSSFSSTGGPKFPSFDLARKPEASKFEATMFKLPVSSAATATSFGFSLNKSSQSENEENSNGVTSSTKSSGDTAYNNNPAYLSSLRALNKNFFNWIKKHLDENMNLNLIPCFDDYKKHFEQLQKKHSSSQTSNSSDKKTEDTQNKSVDSSKTEQAPLPISKASDSVSSKSTFSFGSSLNSSTSPGFNKPASNILSPTSKPDSKIASPSLFSFGNSEKSSSNFSFGSSNSDKLSTTSPLSGGLKLGGSDKSTAPLGSFSFGAGAPTFSFAPSVAAAAASSTASSSASKEDDYSPPQPEVVEVKEDDAVYDKKCKLFYKSDGTFVDKGVGTLYLKPVPDSKKMQLVIRAATNLGNVLLNIVINSSMPSQRMGKNNVLIVCVPNPPIDPQSTNKTPVTMLIRVKTGEDADELLKKIEECKEE